MSDVKKAAPRSRASAKKAGAGFERVAADHLAAHVDDRIDRRVKTGAKDCGDLAGIRAHGQRVVAECKNVSQWSPGPWLKEAEAERVNDGALAAFVIAKRHGVAAPGQQVVLMTLDDLAALLSGKRPVYIEEGSLCRGFASTTGSRRTGRSSRCPMGPTGCILLRFSGVLASLLMGVYRNVTWFSLHLAR